MAIESGRIQLVTKETINFKKPLAIIINPFSGKKRDIRPVIQKRLDMEKISFEFIESTK
jgi:diacylglycerol kinase family enzyme